MDEFIEPGILCLCFHKKLKVRRFSGTLDHRSSIMWCSKCQKGYLDWVISFKALNLFVNAFFSSILGFWLIMLAYLTFRSWNGG